MHKGLALWFSCSSIALLTAATISISHSIWLVLLFGVLTILNIGFGFIMKARLRRREEQSVSS